MAAYPVQLEITSPPRFERMQLLVRLAVVIMLGWLGITSGWLNCLIYAGLPIFAAVAISTQGAPKYADTTGPGVWRVLTYLLGFSAYMLLVVDRVPLSNDPSLRIELRATARPAANTALARLVMSIPSAFVLCLLGIVSGFLLVVAVITVLVGETVPASILSFQTGIVRWQARLLAYHASLVDDYPPFSFTDHVAPTQTSAAS